MSLCPETGKVLPQTFERGGGRQGRRESVNALQDLQLLCFVYT
jgi:hypothetical protein